MQIRVRLGIKFALAIGAVLLLFALTYRYLHGEIRLIGEVFEETAHVRDPALRAAYELKIAVADSALVVRDEPIHASPDWRARQLASERRFEAALADYRRLTPGPDVEPIAAELGAIYRGHAVLVHDVMSRMEQRRSAAPEFIDDVVSFRSAVGALADVARGAPADTTEARRIAVELTSVGERTAALLNGFTAAPSAQEAWQIEENLKRIDTLLDAYVAAGPPLAALGAVAEMRAPIERLHTALYRTLANHREVDIAVPRLRAFQQRMNQLIDSRVLARAHAALVESNATAAQRIASAEWRVALLLALAATIGLGASLLLTRSVLRPVKSLLAGMRAVAAGDLARRVPVLNRDELGDLAASFNRMATELEQSTVSRSFVDAILCSMGEALFVLTPDGLIERANPTAGRLLGTDVEGLTGQPLARFLRAPSSVPTSPGAPPEQDNALLAVDGQAIPVLLSLSPMAEQADGRPRLVCTAIDISARIAAEQALAASRDQLRELYQALQLVQEEERAHLARELHDELGAILTVMKTTLFLLGRQGTGRSPDLGISLAQLHELVDRASAATDRIVNGLRPPILDHFGLGAALEWYAADFEQRTGVGCTLDLPDPPPDLGDEEALALFRVAQECLTNTARHARASHVEICLEARPDAVVLRLRDDGRGCDAARLDNPRRGGLRGLRERIARMQGTLTIAHAPDGGLAVEATLPRRALAA